MSDIKKNNRTTEEIKNSLFPALDMLLTILRIGSLPDEELNLRIRTLLKEYIDALDHEQELRKRIGTVTFADCPSIKLTEHDVINELSGNKENIIILNKIALQKLIPCDSPDISGTTLKRLEEKGYIAKVSVQTPMVTGEYYTLASKGGMCISRKKLADKLIRSSNEIRVPMGLYHAPEKWSAAAFCKTAMISAYFQAAGVMDYFIFFAPGKGNTAIGCEISNAAEIRYIMAAVEEPNEIKQDISYIKNAVASKEVAGIKIVCTRETYTCIMEAYPDISQNNKIEFELLRGVKE